MRFLRLLPLALLAVAGCGKRDVVGRWDFPFPGAPMQLEFMPDGTYSGKLMGAAQVTGTYKVEGKVLALDPPQVSGATGVSVPTGGQMRLEMKDAGPGAIGLSAPGYTFTMTRMDAGAK